jgi:hypothetical protein
VDIVSLIQSILTFCHTWCKALQIEVFISSQDVATAFDSMDHDVLKAAMLSRGLHPRLVFGLLRELTEMKGISMPGAGTSESFHFGLGGKQGGVETPDEWNMLMESILEDVVNSWEDRQFGLRLPGWEKGITHVVWADNVWLISVTKKQLATMVEEHTEAIYAAKLKWKATSLEVLCGGLVQNCPLDLIIVLPSIELLTYTVVQNMEVLGTKLDGKGSTHTSMQHRLSKAEAGFWAKSRTFLGPGSVKSKLRAWAVGPAASALLDASSWTVNKGNLHYLRRWEYRWLRKIFRFRWKPDEGRMLFAGRTARIFERST